MSVINTQPLAGASGSQVTGYNLTKSLRFRSAASAYLSRTMTTPTNNLKWTLSAWVKRGSVLTTENQIINAGTVATDDQLVFTGSSQLAFYVANGGSYYLITNAVYRDPAAWYHIVFVYDSANATASNRLLMYVNGTQVTSFATALYPTQNYASQINSAVLNRIGLRSNSTSPFDGYMAETNFIDGQALTASSFGETDTITGVWKPKRYAGTYGTNGFYLPFTDVATTSGSNAGLGKDFSGNGNYWTTNNISVTTGATYDSMTDVPTLTSATAANYCVMNPLKKTSSITVTNGNLTLTNAANINEGIQGTIGASSGKWYAEVSNGPDSPGVVLVTDAANYPGSTANSYAYHANATKFNNGSSSSYGATFTSSDVIGIALDMDAGTVTFYKNNTSQGTAFTGLVGTFTFCGRPYGATSDWNFGQRPFAFTPPTGFKALNTYNLPDSTIVAGNKVMDALTWTGDNSTANATKNRTGLSFQPDLVWIKSRSNAYSHNIYDVVRGAGSSKSLQSDNTNSESTNASNTALYGYVSAFNSDGFQTTNGTDGTSGGIWVNQSGQTYVGWCWDANGAGSSNTSGSITSTVSVNASAGFSIVTYTGTGANATVGHGLGVAPSLIIWKNRNTTSSWPVWHSSFTAIDYIYLNSTGAKSNSAGNTVMNSTLPSSSVISLGTYSDVNGSGNGQVAYCWSEIAGFSKFGSYTGNGSTDGPFVYTGFRPKFILIKQTDAVNSWFLFDSSRDPYNASQNWLAPNLSNAESVTLIGDFVSNGIKIRSSNAAWNGSGNTYIYMAFAESPFKHALGR